jgi:VWFA-related protein
MPYVYRVALILLVGRAFHVTEEAQQVPFVARTELVQVDVAALDEDRQPILDLTQADFRVLEDGKPRPILAFTRVDVPSTAGRETASAAPLGQAPAAPVGATASENWPDEGRLIVILFDRSIPVQAVPFARRIASAVVDALGPADLAAIVRTSQFAGDGLSQEFTTDRVRLRQAIASPYMGATAPPVMGPSGLMERPPGRDDDGDCGCGICVLEGIRGVAEAIRDVQRLRKVLIFIGSDMATPTGRGMTCISSLDRARSRLLQQCSLRPISPCMRSTRSD